MGSILNLIKEDVKGDGVLMKCVIYTTVPCKLDFSKGKSTPVRGSSFIPATLMNFFFI